MTGYEKLLDQADKENISVIEDYYFKSERFKGLYCDGYIALSKNIKTETEKKCVLAEELGHYYTAVGEIIDQSSIINRKQEMCGRIISYNILVGLQGIINAYLHHCQNLAEIAEYLDVTEGFLFDALSYYKSKYGLYTITDNYAIMFEPVIAVIELVSFKTKEEILQ